MSEEPKFVPGDVVVLRSEGPSLTVEQVLLRKDGFAYDVADCAWFRDDGHLHHARLAFTALEFRHDSSAP